MFSTNETNQVRNLSDSIKIAIDFVSPQSIHLCEKLTEQFREQNGVTAWKEDVLQLRSMAWFAWLSCCRKTGNTVTSSSVPRQG